MSSITVPINPLDGLAMTTRPHLNNARLQRLVWLLQKPGVPHDTRRYSREADTLPALFKLRVIHLLGRSSDITGRLLMIAEPGVIIGSLKEYDGQGIVCDARSRPRQACALHVLAAPGARSAKPAPQLRRQTLTAM